MNQDLAPKKERFYKTENFFQDEYFTRRNSNNSILYCNENYNWGALDIEKVLFITDAISSLVEYKDTSVLMMQTAFENNISIYVCK